MHAIYDESPASSLDAGGVSERGRWLAVAAVIGMMAFAALAQPEPSLPAGPVSAGDLVYARPFRLDLPYRSPTGDSVGSGHVIVVKVDPRLGARRATNQPLLMAGDRPLERIDHGHNSGYVVALLPGDLALSRTAIWFDRPSPAGEPPSKVFERSRLAAGRAGVSPPPGSVIEDALDRGGNRLDLRNRTALMIATEDLVRRYSQPDGGSRARGHSWTGHAR